MKQVDKICQAEGCGAEMPQVNFNKKYCNECSVKRNRKQAGINAKKTHKCKTCDNQISKKRIHCGASSIKGSCAYKAVMNDQVDRNKKPKTYKDKEESAYFRITGKRIDKSCNGSGFF